MEPEKGRFGPAQDPGRYPQKCSKPEKNRFWEGVKKMPKNVKNCTFSTHLWGGPRAPFEHLFLGTFSVTWPLICVF